ncbi:MAG: hypothetical protein ACRELY_00765 [Polyangiaceae bacterium]
MRARLAGAVPTIALAFAAVACNSTPATTEDLGEGDNCNVPSTYVYVCDAAIGDEGACGAFNADGSDGGLDASFAIGCEVRRPQPSGYFKATATCHPAATCDCGLYLDSGPVWLCAD